MKSSRLLIGETTISALSSKVTDSLGFLATMLAKKLKSTSKVGRVGALMISSFSFVDLAYFKICYSIEPTAFKLEV
jgi:hypothetical protein